MEEETEETFVLWRERVRSVRNKRDKERGWASEGEHTSDVSVSMYVYMYLTTVACLADSLPHAMCVCVRACVHVCTCVCVCVCVCAHVCVHFL